VFQQRRDDSGERVAGAADFHPCGSRAAEPRSLAVGDDVRRPFGEHDVTQLGRERFDLVGHVGQVVDVRSTHSCEFPSVGRTDQRGVGLEVGDDRERVRVDDDATGVRLEELPGRLEGLVGGAEPRAQHDHVVVLLGRLEEVLGPLGRENVALVRLDDEILAIPLNLAGDGLGRSDEGEFGAGPKRGLCRERRRAGVGTAADNVRSARATVGPCEIDVPGADEPFRRGRNADIRDADLGREVVHPRFRVVEGDHAVGRHAVLRMIASIGVEPGGHVDGDDGRVGLVDRCRRARSRFPKVAADSRSQHRVDDHVRLVEIELA